MSNVENDNTAPLGLDVGTSRMVVARNLVGTAGHHHLRLLRPDVEVYLH